MVQLAGKTALITGANRGIGLELTRQLLRKGNSVVATARTPSSATQLHQLAAEHANKLTITQLDVTKMSSIEKWAEGLASKFDHFDLVVNNAGLGNWTDLDRVTPDEMLKCFAINTMGPLFVTQQLHKHKLIGRPGTIVANMTSKMGSIDDNGSGGSYAYRASKSALNIVNKSLSIDLESEGVTCVLLHPGWVKTDMTKWNGLIDTEQCVTGLLSVLESDRPLNGRWYDFAGKEIPW